MSHKWNIVPGNIRGRKAVRSKRGLMPESMDWRWPWRSGTGWFRDSEKVPGTREDWYKPLKPRHTNRRDRRRPSKP